MKTSGEDFLAKAVVNAAGVHSDELHNLVCETNCTSPPEKENTACWIRPRDSMSPIPYFNCPGNTGKGVLVSPTVHGNLLLGPTAADIEDREETKTTAEGLGEVLEKSALGVRNIPTRQVITSFTGLRAHEAGDDFVLGETAEGFLTRRYRIPGPFQCISHWGVFGGADC